MHLGASEEKLARVRELALRLTKGWDQARVNEIVRDALENVIEPIIYREAADLIEEHKAAGREVFIVSASPEEIVAPLAEYLGVDGAIASRATIDDEGRYSGEMDAVLLRAVQGRRHARAGRATRHRPRRVVRVLRLVHRRADARDRRPPGAR